MRARWVTGAPMKPQPFVVLFVLAALFGLIFTGFSTIDFTEHLDRQVHAIHCSFIPGLSAVDASASSGCHTALMSPYSSVFRSLIWGGLPMSLLGMGVFAFLLFRGIEFLVNRRSMDLGAALFLVGAAAVPVLTSIVMGAIAIFALGAACKVCIGIYISSFVAFGAALGVAWTVWRENRLAYIDSRTSEVPLVIPRQGVLGHLIGGGELGAFVAVPALLYLVTVPDHAKFVGTCGELTKTDAAAGVFVPVEPRAGAAVAIEVFDPLCSACRGFEDRLAASGLSERLDRKAVLFPLDSTCNWMVGDSLHPGACAVSEAVLCAGDAPQPVIAWAFEHQEEVITATKADPTAADSMVRKAFPNLAACIGGAEVKQRLNRSLRWAVANQLPVLTPQLYVNGKKLCDEDTDLGLDFALSRLLDQQAVAEVPHE